jgi:hypothetical protein
MSSERPRTRLGFRQTVVLAITVLSLAVVGLTLANIAQGPRLLGAELNTAAAVQRAGQLLVLRADQPLTGVEPGQVSVAPAVPVEVSWQGATVEVRFLNTLEYATEYHVSVAVTSAATRASSMLTHSFRTPSAEVYVLQRNGPAGEETADQIVRAVLGATDRAVVYTAERIQEFAVAGSSLAVVTQDGTSAGAGTLTVGPVSGSGAWKTLAADSVITQLQASKAANGVFGFVLRPLSGPDKDQTQLHIYDPAAGDQPTAVLGLDGKPLDPESWAFVPGTRAIVAQTSDALFFLIDTVTGSVKTLGGHSAMHGFVRGSQTMIFEDQGRYTAFDLTSGQRTEIPLGDLSKSALVYQLLALPDAGYVSLVARLEDEQLRFSIVVLGQEESRTIYEPEPADSTIPLVCLSPNGQFLAVEAVPPGNETDGYDVLPGYRKSRVVVIDSATGNYQGEEPGFHPDWCD